MTYYDGQAPSTQPMISMRNVIINGGTFTNYNKGDGRKSPFDILKDAAAHTAFHNSSARFDPPKCHPNTRVAVLKKIMNWIRRCDSKTRDRYIMWLTGAAGAGKSAIAQSIIELCLLDELVIASFFFGKSDSSRNHAGALIATLVYQIYHSVPAVQQHVLSIIAADPLILTRSLERQFSQLITKPLSHICSSGSSWPSGFYRVIVIDGLDECLDAKAQQQILQIISNSIWRHTLPILFLIASRPEHEINVAFGSLEMGGLYTRLYLDDTYEPNEDIHAYLKDNFEKIKMTHPFKSQIPSSWPAHQTMVALVKKSSGQFIYAATVLRYVQSIRHQPHQRLDIVMNLRPPQGELPFAQLDALYATILSSAADIDRVLYALSIFALDVVHRGDYHEFDISGYMSLEPGELAILFCDLGALVSVERKTWWEPEEQYTLRILHASLHDFLLNPTRSKEYFIDLGVYRTKHVANILRYIPLNYSLFYGRVSAISPFFHQNFSLCQSSAELLQSASSFPFSQVLAAVKQIEIAEFILFDFPAFFGYMARQDSQWIPIKEQQDKALDKFFLSKISHRHADDSAMAYLGVLCHAGEDQYIPGFCDYLDFKYIGVSPSWDSFWGDVSRGGFLIEEICLEDIGTDQGQYGQCLIRFLQDTNRSGRYALDGTVYARAALSFMHQISNIDWNWSYKTKEPTASEDYMSDQIVLHEGLWVMNTSSKYAKQTQYNITTASSRCFFLLGYAIFFLARAGKYDPLIQYFQHPEFLTGPGAALFPTRIALIRKLIKAYLEHFHSESLLDNTLEQNSLLSR